MTVGLFSYEIRGIQKCLQLMARGRELEQRLLRGTEKVGEQKQLKASSMVHLSLESEVRAPPPF